MNSLTCLGIVGCALGVLACREVRVEDGGGGSGGGLGGTGGVSGAECGLLEGDVTEGCVERNNPTASVQAEIDDDNYLTYLALGREGGVTGYLCAVGDVTLGTETIEAPPFPASACFRVEADEWLTEVNATALPPELTVDPLGRSARSDRTLVTLASNTSYEGYTAGARPLIGVLFSEGEVPWMRTAFEGSAADALTTSERPRLLSNGDVAIALSLGASSGGTVDFGDGFVFEDDGAGTTAYVARLDGNTGSSVAAFAVNVGASPASIDPLEGADGSFTALVFSAKEGSLGLKVRWYGLDGAGAELLAELEDVTPAARAVVDSAGRLWLVEADGAAGVRVVDREGECLGLPEFSSAPSFSVRDVAPLPSGNLALLVSVEGQRELDGCTLLDAEGDGDAFVVELSPAGDWLRSVRVSDHVPAGAALLDAEQNDLLVYTLEGTAAGYHTQRVERVDWGEAAF